MKKILVIIPLMGILWSCKRQNDISPSQNNLLTKDGKFRTLSSGDGHYDLLGYGYDVTKEFANSNSAGAQVLDVATLDVNNPGRVVPGDSKVQYGTVSYGENAQTFSKDLSSKLTATVGFALFKSNLTLSYSSSDAESSKYVYGLYSLMVQEKSWMINANNTTLQSYLSPAFLADIKNPSTTPAYLIAHYGTHVLSHIILGGKLQVTFQSQTSNSDRKTAAAAGLNVSVKAIFSLDANLNYTSASTTANFNQNLTYISHGGDPSKGLIGQIAFNSTSPTLNIANWQNSVTPQNAELIDIDKDGLIAISDLIPDTYASLKSGVIAYVNQYMSNNQVTVTPDPVYEFTTSILGGRHAYGLNPDSYNQYSSDGWHLDGSQPFKAYASSCNNAVPIYQFYSNQFNDRILWPNPNPGWSGWSMQGTLFYAYSTNVAGSVPVYSFIKQGGSGKNAYEDHYYSTNKTPYDSTWTNNGPAFYTFPN